MDVDDMELDGIAYLQPHVDDKLDVEHNKRLDVEVEYKRLDVDESHNDVGDIGNIDVDDCHTLELER